MKLGFKVKCSIFCFALVPQYYQITLCLVQIRKYVKAPAKDVKLINLLCLKLNPDLLCQVPVTLKCNHAVRSFHFSFKSKETVIANMDLMECGDSMHSSERAMQRSA